MLSLTVPIILFAATTTLASPPDSAHKAAPLPAPVPVGTQQVLFAIDLENDLLPTGFSGGEGTDSQGFWSFDGETSAELTLTSGGGQTGGGLVDRNISSSAVLACTLSPTGIISTATAHATAPPTANADYVTASINFSLTLTIAQPSEFFIAQSGSITTADFSPISGSITGNQLTAGTYRLSLGTFTNFQGPGQTVSRAGAFNVYLGNCAADWNNDAAVNSSDISVFLSAWLASVTAGNLVADVNNDGATNSSDISAFLTRWLSALGGSCA